MPSEVLLGIVLTIYFSLVLGSFAYTYKSVAAIWVALEKIRVNDLAHQKQILSQIEARLTHLEQK